MLYIYIIYICVCVCVNNKRLGGYFRPSLLASIRHRNTIIFGKRKSLYLKEPPAKLLKTNLKINGNICFVVI